MTSKFKSKHNKLTISLLVLFFALSSCVSTKKTLNLKLNANSLNNSFHGLVVVDANTRKVVFDHNGDKYFTPASNTKIVTLYTALKLLPEHIPTLSYAVQNDTLFIKGTGDPSWLHPYLKDSTAFHWLKNQNTIALFTKNHNEDRFGPGWAWEDFDTYFSPEKSTLPLYGNVVTLSTPDGSGLNVSPSFFSTQTELKEAPFKRDELRNYFYIAPTEKDTLEVPFITNDSVTQQLLASVLAKDITLTDHFPTGEPHILYGIKTDSILKRMFLKSDNFLAEQLLLTASSTLSDTLSTKTAITYMLENHLNDLDQQPRWVDGSGLSRYNLFTPHSFVQILQKLYNEVPEERLFGLMPMWGPDSTVETWEDTTTEPFLFAKSGSVGNNYNLSGYIKTKSGKLLIFSFMNNHFRVPSIEIRRNMYETLKGLHENY